MPCIVIEGEDFPRQTIVLDKPLRIGRRDDNDLVIPSALISRCHVRIEPTEHGWAMVDAGSTSGFYVNDERGGASRLLVEGDVFQLAQVRIWFYLKEPPY